MNALVRRVAVIAILGGVASAAQTAPSAPPRFADFPILTVYHGAVKPPELGNRARFQGTDARCFGIDPPFDGGPELVNFAGHFVIATCTCGSGCHYLYMWDAISGEFYQRLPHGAIDIGSFNVGGDRPVEYKGEEYRTNSSLLIVEGCVEGTCDCGRRYYRWTGSQFRLIRRQPVRMPHACLKKSK